MKKFLSLVIIALVCITSTIPVFADNDDVTAIAENEEAIAVEENDGDDIIAEFSLLVDNADLLNDDEYNKLDNKLEEISTRLKCDVAVVTTKTLDGKSAQDYADDYFDYNGYGQGDDRDGVMLVYYITDDERYEYITTRGYGITAITDYGRELIFDEITPYIKTGASDFYKGFDKYADLCDEYITSAKNGKIIDYESSILACAGIGLGFGLIVALIVTAVLKSELKTVAMQRSATNYQKNNSLKITNQNDMFLYKEVTKTKIESSSSGGSSTHTSSSGATHGGGGRSI